MGLFGRYDVLLSRRLKQKLKLKLNFGTLVSDPDRLLALLVQFWDWLA